MREKKKLSLTLIALLLCSATMMSMNIASPETTISIEPPGPIYEPDGGTFPVDIVVTDVADLYGWEATISFDPNVLSAVEEFETETLTVTGEWVGNGTGSEDWFNVVNKPVVTESETVYVDGVAQTRDDDYYMDYTWGVIMFYVAPPADAPVTVDYQWTHEYVVMPEEGNFLKDYFNSTYIKDTLWLYSINNTAGTISLGSVVETPYPETGASGSGLLARVKFFVEAVGSCVLHFERTKLFTVVGGVDVPIEHTAVDSSFDNVPPGEEQDPFAVFDAEEYYVSEEEDVMFDAQDSWDPDGYIVSYDWDFDDGTTDTGMIVTHSFPDGTFDVTLTVTDNHGRTGFTTKTIQAGVFTEFCELAGKCAWSEHKKLDEITEGRINTLYAKVWNNNTEGYWVKVEFEMWGGKEGAPIKTLSTDPVLLPGKTVQVVSTAFDTSDTDWETGWGGPWDTHKNYWPYQYKYMALARCFYSTDGIEWTPGEFMKDFGFMVRAAYHDINVLSVAVDPTTVASGDDVNINVTVRNEGDMDELFYITLRCEPMLTIDVIPVALGVGENTTITYPWTVTVDPLAVPYLIKAQVNKLTYETIFAQVNNEANALLTVTAP